jgi:hypothetical protein
VKSMLLEIHTAKEHYKVTRAGWIERMQPHVFPSPQWHLLGIVRLSNFGYLAEERFTDDLFAGLIPEKLSFKNGKPMWRLAWLDHGCHAISMNDAIRSITLREVVEINGVW